MKKKKAQNGSKISEKQRNEIAAKIAADPYDRAKAMYFNQLGDQIRSPKDSISRVANKALFQEIINNKVTPDKLKGRREELELKGKIDYFKQKGVNLNENGIIEDNNGQYNHPGKITKINSNNITMKGINYPVLGISDIGDAKLMQPNNDYKFKGNNVTEIPMAKSGKKLKKKKAQQGFSMDELVNQDPLNVGIDTTQGSFDPTGGIFAQEQPNIQFPNNQERPKRSPLEALPVIGGIVKGIGMIKEEKNQRDQALQTKELSKIIREASSIRPEGPKRKYVRPEDQLTDPNELFPSYGVGTNYLAKHGKKIKYQDGGFFNLGNTDFTNLGNTTGSLFGGTGGQPTGAGQIGGTIGGTIGSFLPIPGGKAIGSFLGSTLGSLVGNKKLKQTEKYNKQANKNFQLSAFQQGSENIQNQYTGFMKKGGDLPSMNLGGDIKTHWGGKANSLSYNPFLPDTGETIMFNGASHENGGIGVTFGEEKVEVEGGEPAVKLKDGGKSNLTVFGDMKIPSYGIAELQDKDAKGKKFKNYINDLSKKEAKQNKIVDNSIKIIDETPVSDSFDKLKINSNKLMTQGANMKLKDIAKKKQIAASVQNAILDTANEFNLDSGELAKGNIKKARKGYKSAQEGIEIPPAPSINITNPLFGKPFEKPVTPYQTIPRDEVPQYQAVGWQYANGNNNQLTRLIQGEDGNLQPIDTAKPGGTNVSPGWESSIKDRVKRGGFDAVVKAGHILDTPANRLKFGIYSPSGKSRPDYINVKDINNPQVPQGTPPSDTTSNVDFSEDSYNNQGFGMKDIFNAALPFIRPRNRLSLDPNQLSGEMFSLASNQLEPVQAQLYNPLLEQPFDISLQDQMNANQADFNSIQRLMGNNPAAQSVLAAQKYQANSGVLGEQFRQNQAQKAGVFARNRSTLNDAQLKNLGILDQQYVRQSQAKSATKAVAKSALESIGNKIAQNKLENDILGVDQNRYNYRFGPEGRAWNFNPLAEFVINNQDLVKLDEDGRVVMNEKTVTRDKNGIIKDTKDRNRVTTKSKNGSLLKMAHSY